MKFDTDKLYIVEGGFLQAVERVMQRLYTHDSKRMNADESRDLANELYARLTSNVLGEHKS